MADKRTVDEQAADTPYSDCGGREDSAKASLEERVRKLAGLPEVEYQRSRRGEARALGIKVSFLDDLVVEARKRGAKDDAPFLCVEPCPSPVNPATLLTEISTTIRRFIICNKEAADAAALWAAMTWFIDEIQVAPLAVITAPEKRCGKTLLLRVLFELSARAITASNITPAALFRTIDKWKPTLLIDEVDTFMRENEDLRGIINCGHARGTAFVIRTVGDSYEPKRFNVFGAKALAGISHLQDTVMDRAVVLRLRRKLPTESVERLNHATPRLWEELRSKLARFAEDYSEQVREARPPLPENLHDREQDNWEPLLAIAMVAGGEWLETATKAALLLSDGEGSTQTIGTEFLTDVYRVMQEKSGKSISTEGLIAALCTDKERRWATYDHGKPITAKQVAGILKEYGIRSKNVRVEKEKGVVKGFDESNFEDVFARYLPPHITRYTLQSPQAPHFRATDGKILPATNENLPLHATPPKSSCASVAARSGCVADAESVQTRANEGLLRVADDFTPLGTQKFEESEHVEVLI